MPPFLDKYVVSFQSIDDVYWTEDAADEDMMNTYCWMYGHLNLPHDYMVRIRQHGGEVTAWWRHDTFLVP